MRMNERQHLVVEECREDLSGTDRVGGKELAELRRDFVRAVHLTQHRLDCEQTVQPAHASV